MPTPDLAALLQSWRIHLRAQRKSPQTVKVYSGGVRLFLAWCDRTGITATLDRQPSPSG